MINTHSNLRKAAVFLRTLDGETAAAMIAQLSPAEAAALREAMRNLGHVESDEQSDVAAEFRRSRLMASEPAASGVELNLSSADNTVKSAIPTASAPLAAAQPPIAAKRFEFLERAPIAALVPYLAREHAQTIAVVLSHLRPERATAVLAALPGKRQADVVERLTSLGDTDPESITVVERELAAWLEKRNGGTASSNRRSGAMESILAAADTTTRRGILENLKRHRATLVAQFAAAPAPPAAPVTRSPRDSRRGTAVTTQTNPTSTKSPAFKAGVQGRPSLESPRASLKTQPAWTKPAAEPTLPFCIEFDQLTQLNDSILSAILQEIDPGILVLALAGSRDEFVDRIYDHMPRRVARALRRQLCKLGPTRISDMEAAQRAVALAASNWLARRRAPGVVT